jgi:hypothetical protein
MGSMSYRGDSKLPDVWCAGHCEWSALRDEKVVVSVEQAD